VRGASDVITWLFEEESFAPVAKLTARGSYSVITDHLGTPLELYNGQGEKTWQAQLDSYGAVRQGQGKAQDCPFRYQGQYEDVETGLYYNRFRYFSPEEGAYISQDPIRLNGGASLYKYVHDPACYIDPFGLMCLSGLSRKISVQKQARHIAGTARPGGGFLNSVDDAQAVLDAVHSGEATFLGTSRAGHQVYRFNGVTGTNVNLGAGITGQPTNVFMIKGTASPSVVPTSPLWTP
jgi:RHS repeat-associated protein